MVRWSLIQAPCIGQMVRWSLIQAPCIGQMVRWSDGQMGVPNCHTAYASYFAARLIFKAGQPIIYRRSAYYNIL